MELIRVYTYPLDLYIPSWIPAVAGMTADAMVPDKKLRPAMVRGLFQTQLRGLAAGTSPYPLLD
jgi:hypothetical protein